MTLQIILSGLFAFVATAFVVVPLLRRPKHSVRRADYDIQVYKDQLGEIDRDVERSLLTETQASAARVEIQRRMLSVDAEGGKNAPVADTGRGLRIALAIGLAVLVPVGGLALYGMVGAPGLPDRPIAARQAERLGMTEAEVRDLRDSVAALQARMTTKPDDQAGWLELAEGYSRLQDWPQALAAYDRLIRLGGVAPEVWSSLGEAHVFASGGTVSEPAQAAFRNALRLDRAEPRARYYLGLAQSQADAPRKAMAIWRELSATSPAEAPWMPMLRQRMAALGQQAGVMPVSVRPIHALDVFDAEQRGEELALEATGEAAGSAGDAAAAAADAERTAPGLTADEQALVDSMVKGLAERLAANPDDYDGWMRLGRSYGVMRRFEDAAGAYAKAAALRPQDVESRFGQASALLSQAEAGGADKPPPEFAVVVREILAIEPENPEALYFAGLGAVVEGDFAAARTHWTRLLDALPADSPNRQDLEQQIRDLPPAS